ARLEGHDPRLERSRSGHEALRVRLQAYVERRRVQQRGAARSDAAARNVRDLGVDSQQLRPALSRQLELLRPGDAALFVELAALAAQVAGGRCIGDVVVVAS